MNISILIASYGSEEWKQLALERALPSAQTQGVEVLCEHQYDGTNTSSRNALARRAQGDWLLYLDADDQLGVGYVEAMRKAHSKVQSSGRMLFTPAVSYVPHGRGRPARPMFHKEIALSHANWMVIGTLIEREFFLELGGFRDWPHGLEDWDLWSRAWKSGCEIHRVQRAIYIAFRNKNSKHHTLMRNRDEHVYWHQKVGYSNWPEYYDALSVEEDQQKRLIVNGSVSGSLRMIA